MAKQKVLSISLLSLCVLFAGFVFAACGGLKTTEIQIDATTVITEIEKDANYDTTNVIVRAIRSDNSELKLEHSQLTFTKPDTSSVGEKDLIVTYEEGGQTFTDAVRVKVYGDVSSISVKQGTYAPTVIQGATYDASNLCLVVNYEGNVQKEITTGFDVSSISTSTLGTQVLTITYAGQTTTVNVEVVALEVMSIEIDETSFNTEINKGDTFSTNDIVVKATRTDNATITLNASEYTFNTIDTSLAGTQNLIATYTAKPTITDTAEIKVFGDVSSIAVKAGTVETTVLAGQELDTSGIVLIVSYEGDLTKEITSVYDVETIDTDSAGTRDLLVTYAGKTATVEITVSQNYRVLSFLEPDTISSATGYKANSALLNQVTDSSKLTTGVRGFEVTGNQYIVGDDNEFIYSPSLGVVYTGTQTTQYIDKYNATVKVYLQNASEDFEEITGETLTGYVTIDNYNHTFDFDESAIDKVFKIEMLPADAGQNAVVAPVTLEFKVIDGYNIYDAKGLSVLDNTNVESKWTQYKQENGIALDLDINAIVLHNNITITVADIPAIHFYTADEVSGAPDATRVVGSLKDSTDDDLGYIYTRTIASGETFAIEGNYFQISAQEIPLMIRERGESTSQEGDPIDAHTALMLMKSGDDESTTSVEKVSVNNVHFFGNTKKTEDPAFSGGIIAVKNRFTESTFYNNLSQCWVISYFGEAFGIDDYSIVKSSVILDKVNAFDSYNTLLYFFGAESVEIKDSHLLGAGGPVMICDHVDNDETTGEGGEPTNVTTTNSVLESFVAGTEGWFVNYGASGIVTQLKALEGLINPSTRDTSLTNTNKTILSDDGRLNLICVFKSGDSEGLSTSTIRGTFTDATKAANGTDPKFANGLTFEDASIGQAKSTALELVTGQVVAGNSKYAAL
ncbi:MAG: bacterial Ig-like domain-containing protein, partial [Clostridia bacterium]|nr:bacterial Ig-like domain-containing protein [Clostridia bacterium]